MTNQPSTEKNMKFKRCVGYNDKGYITKDVKERA
jgi:hypothetical protein